MHHRLIILSIGLFSILLSLFLFKVLPRDFIPDDDIGFIIAYTEAAQGTSSDQMALYHKQITDALRMRPEIKSILSISSTPQYRQGIILHTCSKKRTATDKKIKPSL